jgi:uncharacterized protein
MSTASPAVSTTAFTASNGPAGALDPSERIGTLDILRGIALLGMFFVHFNDHSTDPGGGFGHAYQRFVELFFNDRFWSMFGILFGAGFAVQMRRAESPGGEAASSLIRRFLGVVLFVSVAEEFMLNAVGSRFWTMFGILFGVGLLIQWRRSRSGVDPFVPRFIRRLLALGVFGVITEVFFGYWVLFEYTIWGIPLLFVRRWSNKAIAILLLVCTMSAGIRVLSRATYLTLAGRPEQFQAELNASQAQAADVNKARRDSLHSADYRTVVVARAHLMESHYTGPGGWFITPTNDLPLFLIGLLALRLGVFEDPKRHRRFIIGCMIFGVVSWALAEWVFPLPITYSPGIPLPLRVAATLTTRFRLFNLIRDMWLSLTYIGAVLLLVAHNPAWLRRLSAFGITGRMALTNYVLQVMVLDFTFSNYAFGLHISAAYAPLAALALFGVDVMLSRWWLSRYRYGPLEWLWRSITYAHWQPLRVVATTNGR